MNKVLIADKLSPEAEKNFISNNIDCDTKLGLSENDIVDIAHNYNAIVVRSSTKITSKIIDAGINLKVLGRAGIGVDNIDINVATDKGVVVMNTPYGNSITTAEHTISLDDVSIKEYSPSRSINKRLKNGKNQSLWVQSCLENV